MKYRHFRNVIYILDKINTIYDSSLFYVCQLYNRMKFDCILIVNNTNINVPSQIEIK